MVSRVGSNQFNRRLRLQADRFEKNAATAIKEAAKTALEILVLGTRVDTGKARSNWLVTRDNPNTGMIDALNPYPKGSRALGAGIAETLNAAGALANGYAAIEEYEFGVDPDLFITNNVRYLRYIPEMGQLTAAASEGASAVLRTVKLL